jgi:hypothetical protein
MRPFQVHEPARQVKPGNRLLLTRRRLWQTGPGIEALALPGGPDELGPVAVGLSLVLEPLGERFPSDNPAHAVNPLATLLA